MAAPHPGAVACVLLLTRKLSPQWPALGLGPRPRYFLCGVPSEHTSSLGCGSQGDALGWYAMPIQGKLYDDVSDSVGLSRSRRRAITAFPVPWAYRVSGVGLSPRFRSRGPAVFPVRGRHRVSDSVGLPRSRCRAITAFPIPWTYRVSGFMPQPYFESHALTGHCIQAQGANPGKTPIKTNPRSEGTPHRRGPLPPSKPVTTWR